VERAFRRQRDVHDLGEVHLEDGQEEFHGRAAHVEIFHRRDADDGRVFEQTVFNLGKMFYSQLKYTVASVTPANENASRRSTHAPHVPQ